MSIARTVAADQFEDALIELTRSGHYILLVERNEDDTLTIISRAATDRMETRGGS